MDSLKTMLLAVSELRATTSYMRDVAEDLAYASQLRVSLGHGYGHPVSLVDLDLGYDFREFYMPGHPNADERGYVRGDEDAVNAGLSHEAQAAYQACLQDAVELEQCAEGEETCEEPIRQTA